VSKRAVIICRGKSIENVKSLQDETFDFCGIVNDFKKELEHEWLRSFIKKQKRVIHYICRETFAILNKKQYDDLNVEYVQTNKLAEEVIVSPGVYGNVSNMGLIAKPLDECIKQYSWNEDLWHNHNILEIDGTLCMKKGFPRVAAPTMGILTTVDVVANLGYKDITVLGIDFYEAEYLTVCSSTQTKEAPKKSGIDRAPLMKGYLKKVMEKFPDTNFTFFTYSTFNPELKNVTVRGIENVNS
jgi:hypothetical protein